MLVSLDEALQFNVKISVLALKHVAVGLERVDFRLDVLVAVKEVVVAEAEVVSLFASNHELVLNIPVAGLTLEQLALQLSISTIFIFGLALQVSLLGKLSVEVSLEGLGLDHKARVLILRSGKLSDGGIEGLVGFSELEVLRVGEFGEFVGSLLGFVQIIVHTLETSIVVLALALSHGDAISESVNFILVLSLLLSELGKFVLEVVGVFTELVNGVLLLAEVSLEGNALLLSAADLVSDGTNLSLVLVVGAILLIGEEAKVLDLLSESVGGHNILVVSVVVVVVLHEFLVLEVAVLLLDSIKLVSQGQVVFVSLLDLEDLGLELGDEQIFLVAGQVDGVIVLHRGDGY